ncbi:MAG: hypothetical protein ACREFU_18650 [Acetobacteraceae bacterium]
MTGRGAVVRRFTPADVRDILTVPGTLEAPDGRLACRQASEAGIAAIAARHREMMALHAARDAEALADVLIRHMERTWERVQGALEAPSRLGDGAPRSGES